MEGTKYLEGRILFWRERNNTSRRVIFRFFFNFHIAHLWMDLKIQIRIKSKDTIVLNIFTLLGEAENSICMAFNSFKRLQGLVKTADGAMPF